jgi:hypothetical protein
MTTMIRTLAIAAFLLAATITHAKDDDTSSPPPASSCADYGCAS